MSPTSEAESAMGAVPQSVAMAEGTPIDRAGTAREVADKIRQGRALLKIVSTPWGVDFHVVEVGDIP